MKLTLAAAMAAAMATHAEDTMTKNLFRDTGKGLEFVSDGWSVRSDGERGWVSLVIGGGEFLQADAARGGIVFRKGDQWFTRFPSRDTISHDDWVGRNGYVADGINLVKLSPDWHRPECELYVGANEKADQTVFLFLADDVLCLRLGSDQNRPWAQAVMTRDGKGTRKARELFAVHRNGTALIVQSQKGGKGPKGEDLPPAELEAGMMKDPAGVERLAIAFPCKGFAANSYLLRFDPVPRAENFVHTPRFDVKSSDDPNTGQYVQGPVNGVLNPAYGPETKLDFGMVFGWLGPEPFNGTAELEIVHSLGQPHFRQRVELKAAKPPAAGGQIRVQFQPKFTLPGVSEVWGRLVSADGRLLWVNRYRMAYDWERYRPKLLVPPDFKDFWDKTLAELRAAPLAPETTRVAEFADHPKFEIYDVTFTNWGGQRLHAMMFVPKAGTRPLPAIVSAHPGATGFGVQKRPDGLYGSELRQDPRFVTIVPLIRGHAPDAKDIPFNHPWWGPLDSRDAYAARGWYCAMTRVIDYLATRPDLVDMKRIIASGGSQGGALALVTAALDPRVAVCLSDCPACCQPQEIIENYGSFGPTPGQVPPGQTLDQLKTMLSYYNPVNLCPWIKCPTYVGSNIGDLTVHSMGPLAAYHNLTGLQPDQKAFYPGYTAMHGSGPGLGAKGNALKDQLGGVLPPTK